MMTDAPHEPTPTEPTARQIRRREEFELACGRAVWIILGVVMAIGLLTFQSYGVTTDEPIRAYTGANWWRYLRTWDAQYLPADRLRYYGALFDMLGVAATDFNLRVLGGTDEYAPKHLLAFVTMWLGLLGTCKLAGRLGPQPLALIALLMMLLSPRWFGAFNNPKDVPFATAFVWAAYAFIRWIEEPRGATTLLFALCVGLVTAVRPFGVLMLPVGIVGGLVAWFGARRAAGKSEPAPDGEPPYAIGAQIPLFAVAALAFTYALWPTLWVSPPWHLPQAIAFLSKFPDGGASLYFGEIYNRDDFAQRSIPVSLGPLQFGVPAHATFIPVWTAIQTPEATLALLGLGLITLAVLAARRKLPAPAWAWVFVIVWLLAPWIGSAIRGSNFSRSGRHFFFLLPAVSVIAAFGLSRLIHWAGRIRMAWLVVLASLVAAGDVAVTMAKLHPYEGVYFSRTFGGLRGATGRFDAANWSEGFAESFAWLAQRGKGTEIRVHAVAGTDVCQYYAARHGMVHNPANPEYFISMYMPGHGWHDRFPGDVIYEVERDGVPLAVVKKLTPWEPLKSLDAKPGKAGDAGAFVRLASVGGRFDLSIAGVRVPALESYSAEDDTGTPVAMRWRIRSDKPRTLALLIGFKGPGVIRAGGKEFPVGDRLRNLPHDAFAGMARVDVPLTAGVNEFVAEGRLRHDSGVFVHWPTTPGVNGEP